MPTHRVYGHTRVAGLPVSRRVDVVELEAWRTSGIAAAIVGSAVSSAVDGSWEVELESDALVIVIGAPVSPYPPLMTEPCRPEPL